MLRPRFTRLLFQRLREGKSINLIGLPLAGCTECLRDVQQLAQEQDIITVYLDMKDYKYNYAGLLQDTHQQLIANDLLEGQKTLPSGINNLAIVVSEYANRETDTFILLDHFDDILDNEDQRLPKSFFDDLNSLRNRSNIAICCVTAKPHLQSKYHFEDEKGKLDNTLSWLDLDAMLLPNLLDEEAAAVFRTALNGHFLWKQEEPQRNSYIRAVQGNRYPLGVIRAIENDWDQHPNQENIDNRLKRITHNLEEHYLRRPKKPTGWYHLFKQEIRDWLGMYKDARS